MGNLATFLDAECTSKGVLDGLFVEMDFDFARVMLVAGHARIRRVKLEDVLR